MRNIWTIWREITYRFRDKKHSFVALFKTFDKEYFPEKVAGLVDSEDGGWLSIDGDVHKVAGFVNFEEYVSAAEAEGYCMRWPWRRRSRLYLPLSLRDMRMPKNGRFACAGSLRRFKWMGGSPPATRNGKESSMWRRTRIHREARIRRAALQAGRNGRLQGSDHEARKACHQEGGNPMVAKGKKIACSSRRGPPLCYGKCICRDKCEGASQTAPTQE